MKIPNLGKECFTMLRYGLVGLLNTAFFTVSVWALHFTGWHYSLYTSLSYSMAIVFSFLLNYSFTFQSKKNKKKTGKTFIRFLVVTISLLLMVQLLQGGLIEYWDWPEWMAIGLGMIFYTGIGYGLNRLWVFGEQKQE